jgi:hypothetical protein
VNEDRTHLNDIQDVCTGPTPEFVVGEVYGLREWHIGTDLGLYGHTGQLWELGKTFHAECKAPVTPIELEVDISAAEDNDDVDVIARRALDRWLTRLFDEDRSHSPLDSRLLMAFVHRDGSEYLRREAWQLVDWLIDAPLTAGPQIQVPLYLRAQELLKNTVQTPKAVTFRLYARRLDHRAGHPGCTCGVYAYHSVKHMQYGYPRGHTVASTVGLIRAHGHVTIGTKGLRAERADLIALAVPHVLWDERDPQEYWKKLGITVTLGVPALFELAERGGYLQEH